MRVSVASTILLLMDILHFSRGDGGCGFCEDGTLSNPEITIALAAPNEIHSCSEWHEISELTNAFSDATCRFMRPFFEAICGCSTIEAVYPQCDLCGSPDLVFGNPSKGLLIPNSNSEQILCGTVHTGVKMGGVPPVDCQILKGINDYCGGCNQVTLAADGALESRIDETIAPTETSPIPTSVPTELATIEVFAKNAKSSMPSSSPTAALTDSPSSIPSNSATTLAPTESPTKTYSSSPSYATTSIETTLEPSSLPSDMPSILATEQPTFKQFVSQSESQVTCDLCPSTTIPGILSDPKKKISLVNLNNRTITKTCGALLWDARAGRDDIDPMACSFLQPFFGALCGCSTFSPLIETSGETETEAQTDAIESHHCKICDDPDHVFQASHIALPIPGSFTTKITCGGLFSASMKGAISSEDCSVISTIADICGGCELKKTKPEPPKSCNVCPDEDSSIFIYKDFGPMGTTFHKALSAPQLCDERRKHDKRDGKMCGRLLHPELEGCVLAPITSFEELLMIQSIIPPEKAAFTAVHKDGSIIRAEAKKCYNTESSHLSSNIGFEVSSNGMPKPVSNENCKVENWMEDLKFGYEDYHEHNSTSTRESKTQSTSISEPCHVMKTGWSNYNTGSAVPPKLWDQGQPSYCNRGPVQEAGAVWAVESDGQNYGDLRDVSMNWPLPGAVYKCCKRIQSCFGSAM